MKSIWAWFKENWKSNLIATVAIIYSAQQFTAGVAAWENHQSTNWRAAWLSLLVAAVGYVVKDSSTHSTSAQVTQATTKANGGK